MGLANRLVAGDELVEHARGYIEDLAARCSPASLAVMKQQVYADYHAGLGAAERDSRRLMVDSFDRPDFAEGVEVFTKKRPPAFSRHAPS